MLQFVKFDIQEKRPSGYLIRYRGKNVVSAQNLNEETMISFRKIALSLGLMATAALADIGAGYERSLAGIEGPAFNFRTESGMIFQLILDAESQAVVTATGPSTKMYLAAAPRFFYPLINANSFKLYAGVGIDYSTMKGNQGNYDLSKGAEAAAASSPKEPMAIEIPARFEYQIHPSVSIHTGAGIKYGLSGANGDNLYGLRGDLIGNAGFTVWFKMDSAPKKAKPAKKKVAPVVEEKPVAVEEADDEEEEEEE